MIPKNRKVSTAHRSRFAFNLVSKAVVDKFQYVCFDKLAVSNWILLYWLLSWIIDESKRDGGLFL